MLFLEEQLEEKHPKGLRIFLTELWGFVSAHHSANKKATSVPPKGSHDTDDGTRPGSAAARGLHLLPSLLGEKERSPYLCLPEEVVSPSNVWCLRAKLSLSKSEEKIIWI